MINRSLKISFKGDDGGVVDEIISEFPALIGRSCNCRIRFASKSISGIHSILFSVCDRFFILDNNSTNGTFINGVEIKAGILHRFNPGDVIRIADRELSAGTSEETIEGGTRTALAVMLDGMTRPGLETYFPCLLMLNGSRAGKTIPLHFQDKTRELTFKQDMDFVSLSQEQDSAGKAIFAVRQDREFQITIFNNNFISKIRNAICRPIALRDGGRISINGMEILFLCPESFSMEDVSFEPPDRKKMPRGLIWLATANFILAAVSVFLAVII